MVEIEEVALDSIEVFEAASGGTDLSEFEGQKKKLDKFEVIDGTTTYDVNGDALPAGETRPVKLLKGYTEKVTEFEKDGEKIPVFATEIFNMKEVDGKWGVSSHEKAKIQRLMAKTKAKSLGDLKGKEVMIRTRQGNDGNQYLGYYVD